MIIGIDPGQSGGLAMVSQGGELISGIRMAVLGHGKRKLVDTSAIDDWLRSGRPLGAEGALKGVVIEQVSSMPGQGVASTFNFGRHVGSVEGWALTAGAPTHWVTPQKWKKSFGLTSDKRASLDRARLEFGDDPMWKTLANDGIAEAGLIALHWLRYTTK